MNSVFYSDILEYLELRKRLVAPSTYSVDRCALLSFDQHLAQRGKGIKNISEEDISSWLDPMRATLSCHTIRSKVAHYGAFLDICSSTEQMYIPLLYSKQQTITLRMFFHKRNLQSYLQRLIPSGCGKGRSTTLLCLCCCVCSIPAVSD